METQKYLALFYHLFEIENAQIFIYLLFFVAYRYLYLLRIKCLALKQDDVYGFFQKSNLFQKDDKFLIMYNLKELFITANLYL